MFFFMSAALLSICNGFKATAAKETKTAHTKQSATAIAIVFSKLSLPKARTLSL